MSTQNDKRITPVLARPPTLSEMRHRRLIVVCLGLAAIVAACIVGWFAVLRDDNGLSTARQWARLDELPPSARDVDVNASGGAFSRTIEVRFVADASEIEEWLRSSPGTASIAAESEGQVRHFAIEPGGGANIASVEVDDSRSAVYVYTSWS